MLSTTSAAQAKLRFVNRSTCRWKRDSSRNREYTWFEVVFAQLLELIDIPVPKRAVFGYLKDIQRMHATSLAGQGDR